MTITDTMTGEVQIPKNMHLIEKSNRLEFEYSWFKPKYIISLIAAPFFIFFLVNSSFIYGDFGQLTTSVFILLGFGLFVVYYSLAKLMNTTTIVVNNHEIVVRSSPLPLSKNLVLKKENVKQLFVTQHRVGHRYYVFSTTYQINVILDNKDVITLVKDLGTAQQGRFIEQKIEDFLNITDVHVEGELNKG